MKSTECMKQFLTELDEKIVHSFNHNPDFEGKDYANLYWDILRDTLREYGYVIKRRKTLPNQRNNNNRAEV